MLYCFDSATHEYSVAPIVVDVIVGMPMNELQNTEASRGSAVKPA